MSSVGVGCYELLSRPRLLIPCFQEKLVSVLLDEIERLKAGGNSNTSAAAALAGCKLTYFGLPGRGEAIRLALKIGNIQHTDCRIEFAEWGALKSTTPWGALPILELADGTKMAQQRAILRFVGKCVGVYPADALAAAKCDEIMDVIDDIAVEINKVSAERQYLRQGMRC
jgi:hypothetical protein